MSNSNFTIIRGAEITSLRMVLIWLLNSSRTNNTNEKSICQRWNESINKQILIKYFKRCRKMLKNYEERVEANRVIMDGLLWLNAIFGFHTINCQFNCDFYDKFMKFHQSVPKSIDFSRNRNPISHQIIIVGAGMAGIGAALTLCQHGFKDIKILEAEEEPGGRLKTLELQNGIIELGAQWIHGKENNCLYRIAEEHNLLSDITSEEGCGLYIRDDGFIFDTNLVKEVRLEIEKIMVECEKFVDEPRYPCSFGDFLEERFRYYLNCTKHCKEVATMKKELFDWHIRFLLVDNSCRSLKDISAKEWGRYIDGTEYVNLKNGYKSLVNILFQKLPGQILCCKRPVANVNWSNNSNVIRVYCLNGEEFYCDHVIMTASLGVLKNIKNLFYPSLPYTLQESINSMGFYGIAKIFLIFEYKWWDANGFQLIWKKSTKLPEGKNWTRSITGFDVIYNHSNVLLGWVSGEGVLEMEKLTEREVRDDCVDVLQRFLKISVPNPVKVIKSTWMSSPWVRGGYSHITPQCDKTKTGPTTLSEPVVVHGVPKIFFAGEACSPTHFSTTHGAFESGQAQAQILVDFLK